MTHRPVLASDRLTHFHHSLVGVDSYCVSGSSYGMSVGHYGMGVNCYGVRVQSQFGLGRESLARTKREHI